MIEFRGKVAVITGASGGIGEAIAIQLARARGAADALRADAPRSSTWWPSGRGI